MTAMVLQKILYYFLKPASIKERSYTMDKDRNIHMTDVNEEQVFTIEEFKPEIFDCEADGCCGSGHIHVRA